MKRYSIRAIYKLSCKFEANEKPAVLLNLANSFVFYQHKVLTYLKVEFQRASDILEVEVLVKHDLFIFKTFITKLPVWYDERLEISEIEIIFEEEKIELWLDSESDFLDSILKLVFIDEGSIELLEITSSSTPLISSTETSNQY